MKKTKNQSEYLSENLMHTVIEEVLEQPEFRSFKCVLHVPLRAIVRNCDDFEEAEKVFIQHPWTHVDFLIYNKLDKEPVLVVEVDGHQFHTDEKQIKIGRAHV